MEHLGGIDVFFSQNMGDGPVHECFRLGCLLADMHNGISVRKEKILVKTRRYQLYIISYIYYYISLWLCKLANIFFISYINDSSPFFLVVNLLFLNDYKTLRLRDSPGRQAHQLRHGDVWGLGCSTAAAVCLTFGRHLQCRVQGLVASGKLT